MPRKLPQYVVKETTRHEKIVFYFRKGKGERIRLKGVPGTKEFKASYDAALMGQPLELETDRVKVKSLRWLVERYMDSAKWAGLSVATRKQQSLFFQKAVETSGNANFRHITARDIRAALEDRKRTPALANNFLKAMNGMFTWAVANLEDFPVNPCAGVQRLKNKTNGFPVWSMAEVDRFCDKWPVGTRARLALELLINSGMRRSDVCVAGKQHLTGNIFSMRTQKTNTIITVEFSETLLETISKTPTGDLHFITNENGKPFTVESFGNWFRDRCRDAKVYKSAHGLRKLSATIAADSGATSHELMSQYGWSNTQQADVYTKLADRARLGVKASRLVAEHLEANKSPHLKSGKGKTQKKDVKSSD